MDANDKQRKAANGFIDFLTRGNPGTRFAIEQDGPELPRQGWHAGCCNWAAGCLPVRTQWLLEYKSGQLWP
ncbi:hypothetical protein SBA4_6600005 [Candidatus Sulfopaludibacter sp. SbA4]|nr:hypothetical protein SBA4_6600005 [Candidatus Sulfopaludibacter sp. SbA4]